MGTWVSDFGGGEMHVASCLSEGLFWVEAAELVSFASLPLPLDSRGGGRDRTRGRRTRREAGGSSGESPLMSAYISEV